MTKPLMDVSVECPVCGKQLNVPVRRVLGEKTLTIEPDYSEAQRHVIAHQTMTLPPDPSIP